MTPSSPFYHLSLISGMNGIGSSVSKRLKLVSYLKRVIEEASRLRLTLKSLYKLSPSQVTAKLDRISNMAIYAVYLEAGEPRYKGVLSRYLSSWQHVESNITGVDLREKGLDPGPRYSEILTSIRNAWLDDEIRTKKEEKNLLKSLLTGENQE